jgi:hypothetical protein
VLVSIYSLPLPRQVRAFVPPFHLSHLISLFSALNRLIPLFSEVCALFSLYLRPGSPANLLESTDSTLFPLTWRVGEGERKPTETAHPTRMRVLSERSEAKDPSSQASILSSLLRPFSAKSDELNHIESHSCIKTRGGTRPKANLLRQAIKSGSSLRGSSLRPYLFVSLLRSFSPFVTSLPLCVITSVSARLVATQAPSVHSTPSYRPRED